MIGQLKTKNGVVVKMWKKGSVPWNKGQRRILTVPLRDVLRRTQRYVNENHPNGRCILVKRRVVPERDLYELRGLFDCGNGHGEFEISVRIVFQGHWCRKCGDIKKESIIPWNKGKPHTDADLLKMSAAQRSRFAMDGEHKRSGLDQTGRIPWNKGKHGLLTPETIEKMKAANVGHKGIGYWVGKKIPAEYLYKMSQSKKRLYNTERGREILRRARSVQIMPKIDTRPELAVQAHLVATGIVYSKHQIIRDILIGTPWNNLYQFDIVIENIKTIIEVQGCYWHACPTHRPSSSPKMLAKRNMDNVIRNAVEGAGWKMIWAWEHDIKNGAFKEMIDAEIGAASTQC
jgi:DNA mismatch endonuclease (patch repair protein)